VSGEAILSAENSGKPLGGRGSAPNPAEELTALSQIQGPRRAKKSGCQIRTHGERRSASLYKGSWGRAPSGGPGDRESPRWGSGRRSPLQPTTFLCLKQ